PGHRIFSTQLGFEALPTRGALRVEMTSLSGSLLPVSGFTQGAVVDAERSRGHGVRISSASFGQRVRADAGVALSRFELRPDASLGDLDSLVQSPRETRRARYLDVTADVLRWSVRDGAIGSFAVGYAHERVDPLYRSAGAYVQSDRTQDRVNARLAIGALSLGAHHQSGHNNLDDVPSILTTETHRSGGDLSLPLAFLLGTTSRWLPNVGMQFGRTYQRGRSLPTAGGFDPSHVPDQLSQDATISLVWQGTRGSFTLHGNRSSQDNRQPGRERADLHASTLGAQTLTTLHRHLAVSSDVTWSTSHSMERDEAEHTTRFAIAPTLNPAGPLTLQLQYAATAMRSDARSRRDDTQLSAQLAAPLPRPLARLGNWFLRYARQANDASDPRIALTQRLRHWTVDGGLTMSLR
ncbi:MAG: hypothetical protein AB1762_17335, partial [Gemmatimonadota bacterium]